MNSALELELERFRQARNKALRELDLIDVRFRPLLTSATTGTTADGRIVMLIDNEQSELEQQRALGHEIAHLVGIEDESLAEILGRRIADAVPELLDAVKAAHALP